MAQAQTVTIAVLVASGLLSAGVSYSVWQHRPRKGATWLAVTALGFLPWSLGQAMVASTSTPAASIRWFGLSQLGIALVPTGWLLFACAYTGRDDWWTRPRLGAVWSVSAAFVLLAIGNPADLVVVDPRIGAGGDLAVAWGPAAWTYFAYIYVLLAVAEAVLLAKMLRSRNVYRRRTAFFLLIGAVLWVAHAVDVAGVAPTSPQTLPPLVYLAIGTLSLLVSYDYTVLKLLPVDRALSIVGSCFDNISPIARNVVIEEMGSGVVVLDTNNRIVDLNPVARQIFDAENRRIVGLDIGDVVDADVFLSDDLSFFDPDVTQGHFTDVWAESTDSGRRCYDVVITDLARKHDGLEGRVAIIHDVTEQQRRKRQLERQALELHRQNDQLDEFAGVVSHDLRNPLSVAEGAVTLSRETGETRHLEKAQRAHERMDDIIGDLLTLARQGQSIDDRQTVPLQTVAERAWNNVDSDDADLVRSIADGTAIDADEKRLQQVFENLFRNAIEHGRPDAPADATADEAVTITVGDLSNGFFVADDGQGISPGKRRQVLEEGYTTNDDGTGLGLAIVKTVVDAHGWGIRIGESDGGGARFDITGVQSDRLTTVDDEETS